VLSTISLLFSAAPEDAEHEIVASDASAVEARWAYLWWSWSSCLCPGDVASAALLDAVDGAVDEPLPARTAGPTPEVDDKRKAHEQREDGDKQLRHRLNLSQGSF